MTQAFVNVLLGEGQSNNVPEMDDWGTYILSIEIDARHIEPETHRFHRECHLESYGEHRGSITMTGSGREECI